MDEEHEAPIDDLEAVEVDEVEELGDAAMTPRCGGSGGGGNT